MPLERAGMPLLDTGCRTLFFSMLVSKLKNLLGVAAVMGTTLVAPSPSLASGCTEASFYGGAGDGFAWETMANGKPMNPSSMITAHRNYPFGTRLRVTNQSNGKSVTVTVGDRGPYIAGRDLDLSIGAFSKIASTSQGVARVCYYRV